MQGGDGRRRRDPGARQAAKRRRLGGSRRRGCWRGCSWLDGERSPRKGAARSAPEASPWLSLCLAETGRAEPGSCQELPAADQAMPASQPSPCPFGDSCGGLPSVSCSPHAWDGLRGALQRNNHGIRPPARCSPPALPSRNPPSPSRLESSPPCPRASGGQHRAGDTARARRR